MQDMEFLEFIVKALVDHPEDVKIDRKVDEMGVLISLSVNPEDMGKVIGRAGSTARAIRTLLRVVGIRNGSRVNLRILDQNQNNSVESSNEQSTSMEEVEDVIDDLKEEK